ncbi:PREDICTED: lysosomal alpha-mannosidase isoform X1 [Nicrophorus vespilloides]|uniref:Alpha-mannosidase n=1 Tax=Nicrophorus vespilloides TaxID=110193 RepID=A0ABM1NGV2_NICVS|nr:PREDICTED: lysosomal alpha-mannosidase isoform X1 [Nicrophorus vespilloides]
MMLLILFLTASALAAPQDAFFPKCGYKSCHKTKDGFINVHIVAHTHDDVGWLKTVDQYYYGSKTNIQKAGVQYILDSVMEELKRDSNRRFIYVETAFFWKWWMKQHDFVKNQVRKFVNNGQLEFIGGAWSMNDEAVTHYQSIIDQFTWGLRKLEDTFGKCGRPKVGWQIDPFGHSREMASIFAQLGFDGLLLGRIDYQDKKFRFTTRTPEMVWRSSANLGESSDLFTSVMYNTYSPPPGFCFDVLCDDEPIIDDKKSDDYNVPKRFKEFLDYVKEQRFSYATNNLIVTMGGDFTYMDANFWFKNIDKLISYGNELQKNGSKYNLIYSTPSCYLKAVHDEGEKRNLQWKVKTDDFFPYASDPNAYWTGYFTSRPTIKRFERVGNNFLQICKQLYALTDLGPEDGIDLNALREAMGVMQHHDAITGTEKEHVAHDYSRILDRGIEKCGIVVEEALNRLITNRKESELKFDSCPLLNVSQCDSTENHKTFVVTIYNPLSRNVTKYVRLPVKGSAYKVQNSEEELKVQLVPIHQGVLNIPGRESEATKELIFQDSIPALGFKSFYVSEVPGDIVSKEESVKKLDKKPILLKIDERTGMLFEITMNGKTIPLQQNFGYYRGAVGDNDSFQNRSSGAYIFRPNGTDTFTITDNATYKLYLGAHVTELHQTFSNWVTQTIKVYAKQNHVEFDWVIGPIPIDDVNGKEIISRYTTNLKSESTFYTDSNGREMLKRVRDFRPSWKLNLQETISGNYYPVTSRILLRDASNDIEMAIVTDRAQGGSSLADGELELMIHRNCMHDDAFGVGEALMEEAFGTGLVVRGSHHLVVGPYLKSDGISSYERQLLQEKVLDAWTFITPTNLSFVHYKNQYKMKYSGLTQNLPDNVQILTLEPWKGNSYLLRLEHIFEKGEDKNLSTPVSVNLKDLFTAFKLKSFKETTLGANQLLGESKRLQFRTGSSLDDLVDMYDFYEPVDEQEDENWIKGKQAYRTSEFDANDINFHVMDTLEEDTDRFQITLLPMQIRTFVIEIKRYT